MTMPPTNGLLDECPLDEAQRLWSCAERVTFAPGDIIQAAGPLSHAHFLTEGAASLWHEMTRIELGVIGSEGMVGHPLILSLSEFPFEVTAFTHIGALKIGREALDRAMRSPAVRSVLFRYVESFAAGLADAVASAAHQTIKARLARRLLLVSERIGDHIHATHDQLAQCLCVRRPGVTVTLHELEGDHMIRSNRGAIVILDRERLSREAQLPLKRRTPPDTPDRHQVPGVRSGFSSRLATKRTDTAPPIRQYHL